MFALEVLNLVKRWLVVNRFTQSSIHALVYSDGAIDGYEFGGFLDTVVQVVVYYLLLVVSM